MVGGNRGVKLVVVSPEWAPARMPLARILAPTQEGKGKITNMYEPEGSWRHEERRNKSRRLRGKEPMRADETPPLDRANCEAEGGRPNGIGEL